MNQDKVMAYFFEFFEGLPQQAPGSAESTGKMWDLLPPLKRRPRILDAGCGNGRQSVHLAQLSKGEVVAIDLHQPFLKDVDARARDAGLEDKVRTLISDMGDLDFPRRFFDIIWSEGAIYNVGFEAGLRHWRRYLRKPGFVVVTECCMLTDTPSPECAAFWAEEYPDMPTIDTCIAAAGDAGYDVLNHFVLPESDWSAAYYGPMERELEPFAEKYAGIREAEAIVKMCRREIDIQTRFGHEYGYVCFVMQRTRESL